MNVKDVKNPSMSFEFPTAFTSFIFQKRGDANLLKSSNRLLPELELKSFAKWTMAHQNSEPEPEIEIKYSHA